MSQEKVEILGRISLPYTMFIDEVKYEIVLTNGEGLEADSNDVVTGVKNSYHSLLIFPIHHLLKNALF